VFYNKSWKDALRHLALGGLGDSAGETNSDMATRHDRQVLVRDYQWIKDLASKQGGKLRAGLQGERKNPAKSIWRRGEGVEPSGNRNTRKSGFEDRWGHRAPSSSTQ
jgi:hypothetical protein